MPRFKVGVQLRPQHCSIQELLSAWRAADALGVDSIWTWDHFFPLFGPAEGRHNECMSVLAAAAVQTSHAQIGAMVTCNSYRNPNLTADIARTIDHLSGGRFVLGLGSGWAQRDYAEYGYEYGTKPSRLKDLGRNLPIIKARLAALNPPPIGPLPILIGGAGLRVTLRLVARHADMWNSFGPAPAYAGKHQVLLDWCAQEGRDPNDIECSVSIQPGEVSDWPAYIDAGARHFIVELPYPFDFSGVEQLLHAAQQ